MNSMQLKMIDDLVKTPAAQDALNKLTKALATDMRNNSPLVSELMSVLGRLTDTSDELLASVGLVDRYAIAGMAGGILQMLKKIQKEG